MDLVVAVVDLDAYQTLKLWGVPCPSLRYLVSSHDISCGTSEAKGLLDAMFSLVTAMIRVETTHERWLHLLVDEYSFW